MHRAPWRENDPLCKNVLGTRTGGPYSGPVLGNGPHRQIDGSFAYCNPGQDCCMPPQRRTPTMNANPLRTSFFIGVTTLFLFHSASAMDIQNGQLLESMRQNLVASEQIDAASDTMAHNIRSVPMFAATGQNPILRTMEKPTKIAQSDAPPADKYTRNWASSGCPKHGRQSRNCPPDACRRAHAVCGIRFPFPSTRKRKRCGLTATIGTQQ